VPFENRIQILLVHDRYESGRVLAVGNLISSNGRREGAEEHYNELVRRAGTFYYETARVREAIIGSLVNVCGVFPEAKGELAGIVAKAEEIGDKRLMRWIVNEADRIGNLELKEIAERAAARLGGQKKTQK
jgi:hypothetical protein